jgi:hypothetical protein
MSEGKKTVSFVLAWVLALWLVWSGVSALAPHPVPLGGTSEVRLTIEGLDWRIDHEATTRNNTVFRLLREASVTLGFELDYVEYGWPYNDVFVTSINGTRNDGARNLWWQYCVNGTYASQGALHQDIRDGNAVLWVYAAPGGAELCR